MAAKDSGDIYSEVIGDASALIARAVLEVESATKSRPGLILDSRPVAIPIGQLEVVTVDLKGKQGTPVFPPGR